MNELLELAKWSELKLALAVALVALWIAMRAMQRRRSLRPPPAPAQLQLPKKRISERWNAIRESLRPRAPAPAGGRKRRPSLPKKVHGQAPVKPSASRGCDSCGRPDDGERGWLRTNRSVLCPDCLLHSYDGQ